MSYQQPRFQTNGSNALKEDFSYDVYIKPQFLNEHSCANILEFNEARQNVINAKTANQTSTCNNSVHTGFKCMVNQLANALKNNWFIKDLLHMKKGNSYNSNDFKTFAKGFTVTGIAVLALILFGV
jgi:hypothetical protein